MPAVSVSPMFGATALYHRGNWTARWYRRLQRLDHAMVFLLIAGTATPLSCSPPTVPSGLPACSSYGRSPSPRPRVI
jgi:hemolysin III